MCINNDLRIGQCHVVVPHGSNAVCSCVQVHDVSPEEGEGPNFDLLDAIEYWEVPIEGGPPPDNPVPAGDGSPYSAPAAAPAPAQPAAAPTAAAEDLFTDNGGDFRGPAENGHSGPVRTCRK